MAHCLVLGANGFIGSHLVDSLIEKGNSVRTFDRPNPTVLFERHERVEIVEGDFLNHADLASALEGIDYVFHFISTTTPASAENDPLIDVDTNIRASIVLFQECVKAGVKRVVFASTGGAIYGGSGEKAHSESDITLPISPYAIGKLTIEHYLRYFRVKHDLDSLVVRISNPYGERQPFHRKQGVIPIFIESVYRGEPITILGDGTMVRDYIYIKDVAAIISSIFDQQTAHHTYNIGSGTGVSVNEIADIVEKVVGKPAERVSKPVPKTFLPKVVLETKRLTSEFGRIPLTPMETGIRATFDYIKGEIAAMDDAS